MTQIADIPKFAFGTDYELGVGAGRIVEGDLRRLILRAAEIGVRHFDCSPVFGTQTLVGSALKQSMRSITREEFFIASRLPINMMRDELIDRSLNKTLAELQTNYLDLYLIDAPFSTIFLSEENIYPLDENGFVQLDDEDSRENLFENAWRKLVDLKTEGILRYIGVSNVNLEQLHRLHKIHPVDVASNEFHLYNQDRDFFDNCEEFDVYYEGYSCLGNYPFAGRRRRPAYLTDSCVRRVARSNGLTNVQVFIQWIHTQPLSYVVRAENLAQLEELWAATKWDVAVGMNELIELDAQNRYLRFFDFSTPNGLQFHSEFPFNWRPYDQNTLDNLGRAVPPRRP